MDLSGQRLRSSASTKARSKEIDPDDTEARRREIGPNDKPILTSARVCESRFSDVFRSFKWRGLAKDILVERQKTYASWAEFHGAFEEEDASLDHQSRRLPQHRNRVLLSLLDMRKSLDRVLSADPRDKVGLIQIYCPDQPQYDRPHTELERSLLGLEKPLLELKESSMEIRHSYEASFERLVYDFASKVLEHRAERFEVVARTAVDHLYPDSSTLIRERLSQLMTMRYSRLCYWQTTDKNPRDDAHAEASSQRQHWWHQPEPATTVFHGRAEFPKPPKTEVGQDRATCPYCRETFPAADFADPKWWRKHTNDDLFPFMCLSSKCVQMPILTSRSEWIAHMEEHDHGVFWSKRPTSTKHPESKEAELEEAESEEAEPEQATPGAQPASHASQLADACLLCSGTGHVDDAADSDSIKAGGVAARRVAKTAMLNHLADHLQFLVMLTLDLSAGHLTQGDEEELSSSKAITCSSEASTKRSNLDDELATPRVASLDVLRDDALPDEAAAAAEQVAAEQVAAAAVAAAAVAKEEAARAAAAAAAAAAEAAMATKTAAAAEAAVANIQDTASSDPWSHIPGYRQGHDEDKVVHEEVASGAFQSHLRSEAVIRRLEYRRWNVDDGTNGRFSRERHGRIRYEPGFLRRRLGPRTRLLWIEGGPGAGKTTLLGGIIGELEQKAAAYKNSIVASYFCQSSHSHKNSHSHKKMATDVLRSLMSQITTQQASLARHLGDQHGAAGRPLLLDLDSWLALSQGFKKVLLDPNLRPAYLVIDAVECVTDLPMLLDWIVHISLSPSRVKWLISSRNEPCIREKLSLGDRHIRLSLDDKRDATGSISPGAGAPILDRDQLRAAALWKKPGDGGSSGYPRFTTERLKSADGIGRNGQRASSPRTTQSSETVDLFHCLGTRTGRN